MASDLPRTGLLGRLRARVVTPRAGRILALGLLVLVVAYGALLRFDAITLDYGPVSRPAWLRAVQQSRTAHSVLRPDAVTWSPVPYYPHREGGWTKYSSDPYTYLKYARGMRSFYAAHYREPLFPFVTRIFLELLRNQDVAVSFASASFSVLAIVATYLLGAYAFSRGVGLGAALAMAIECDLISWGVIGLRDDAFTCAVVLFSYALVRYLRGPSRGNAILAGVVAGLACLLRITALSFIVPGFAYVLLTTRQPWKQRLNWLGVGVLTMIVIVGPYLFNCWRVFGDPFYAINSLTHLYQEAEGPVAGPPQTVSQYFADHARTRPMQLVDTVVLGLTSYPFLNKWQGFQQWLPSAGIWLSRASLVGLFLFFGSRSGRLLLVVLGVSLLPFCVTWRLMGDWRLTEHAYPFFLIAACFAISQVVTCAAPSRIRTLFRRGPGLKQVLFWGLALGGVGLCIWGVTRVLPVRIIEESLRANEAVTIEAGDRDGSFFVQGWSAPLTEGGVATRVSEGPSSVVRIPLIRADDYDLTVRLDPFPRPLGKSAVDLPTVRVFMNDHPIATVALGWNAERVGSYGIHVPASVTRQGFNRLTFVSMAKPGADSRFRVWLVRVRPPGS